MPDFNYILFGEHPDGRAGVMERYVNHSTAMRDARWLKYQEPSWMVWVEVLPAEEVYEVFAVLDEETIKGLSMGGMGLR